MTNVQPYIQVRYFLPIFTVLFIPVFLNGICFVFSTILSEIQAWLLLWGFFLKYFKKYLLGGRNMQKELAFNSRKYMYKQCIIAVTLPWTWRAQFWVCKWFIHLGYVPCHHHNCNFPTIFEWLRMMPSLSYCFTLLLIFHKSQCKYLM